MTLVVNLTHVTTPDIDFYPIYGTSKLGTD